MAPSLTLTTKQFNTEVQNPVTAQFSTTSVNYVDVTGSQITAGIAGKLGVKALFRDTGNPVTRDAKLINITKGTSIELTYGGSSTGTVRSLTTIDVDVGDQLKLQVKVTGGSGVQDLIINANSIFYFIAPFTNATDFFVKAHVTKFRIIGLGGAEGIHGVISDMKDDDDFQEIDVNGVMSRFIFSANSGKLLFDWSGSSIGVQ